MTFTQPHKAISLIPYGAILQSFKINGKNIVQGFPTAADYAQSNPAYFGATIGRIANRISGARINSLNNGQSYALSANNGPNSLHGGPKGWDKKEWKANDVKKVNADGVERDSVLFQLVSEDGDEGYPGKVLAKTWYTAWDVEEGGRRKVVLEQEWEAELTEDNKDVNETVINMTNHSYFNLAQADDIRDTVATLSTTHYLPVDDGGIPNAPITTYPNLTPNSPFTLGPSDPDIDDCFVRDPSQASSIPIDTRTSSLDLIAKFSHPATNINLEIFSTEPAFQFYTGKFIDVPAVQGQGARGKRAGFCVEPSRYVNAVNTEEWKGQVLLKKGEVYGGRMRWVGWEEGA